MTLDTHTVMVESLDEPPEELEVVADAAAPQRLAEVLSAAQIDALLPETEQDGRPIDGPDGLIGRMVKAVLERALETEMADHLGYERGDPAGIGSPNSRNGMTSKTVITTAGQTRIDVPRDRAGTFDPRIVPKHARRLGSTADMILSLYARGMTIRDIKAHLSEVYGVDVSHETVAKVTEVVVEEIRSWQSRPVDEVYPIVFIDAIRIKVRDGGTVTNNAAHLVVGVDIDGYKHVLGIWVQATEGAKFWRGAHRAA
jgi:putative transposase